MIITRNHAMRLVREGKATLVSGGTIHNGQRYQIVERHDLQRVDHYIDDEGLSDEAKARIKDSIQQAINPNPRVVINAQILDGNLGDGWADNYEAALALAKFTQEVWARDVSSYQADFEFNIDVEKNTSGAAREVSVYADDWQQAQAIESVLTDPGEIWVSFCESEEAKPFFK